jgi:uncharacterized membrane protein YfcA
MKPKLAPRHIIPTVCYALLLVGFALVALIGCSIDFSSSESLEGSGIVGLLVVGIAVGAKLVLILIGIGGALVTLPPLVLSSINIAWRGRIPAIVCLIYDITWCQVYLGCLFALFPDFTSLTPLIVGIPGLILCALPGSVLGNHLVNILDAALIRKLFGGMLIVTGLPSLLRGKREKREKQD